MTWWQLRLNSKEDICVTLCHLLVEDGRPARRVILSTCGTSKCAHFMRRSLDQESTAVDSGNSDTRTIEVVSFHSRVLFATCQWLFKSMTLANCVG